MLEESDAMKNRDVETLESAECDDCGLKTNVDQSRRRLARIGVAAPILMSLTSRPALAGNCLSNILSGNLSDPDRGSCQCGWSPGGWGQPVGEINGLLTLAAWDTALAQPDAFGVLDVAGSGCTPQGQPANKWECYTGGVLFNETHLAAVDATDSRPLREVVNDTGTDKRHCATAYLNARLAEVSPNFQYMLTVQQVIDLCNGAPVPGGVSLRSFLDFTWCEPHGTGEYSFPDYLSDLDNPLN